MVGTLSPHILVPLGQEWRTCGSATTCPVPLAMAPHQLLCRAGAGDTGNNGTWPRLPPVLTRGTGSLHTLPTSLQAAQTGSGRAWWSPHRQHRHPRVCVLPPAASWCSLHSHFVTGSRPCSPGAGTGAGAKPLCCAADSCGKSGCSRMNPAGAAVSWCISSIFRKKLNKILLKLVKVAKRQQCALYGALLTKPSS